MFKRKLKIFRKILIIAKKYGIFKIQKAINLYKLHIILLLEIAKKLVNPAIKLELKKAVNPAINWNLKKRCFQPLNWNLKKGGLEVKL